MFMVVNKKQNICGHHNLMTQKGQECQWQVCLLCLCHLVVCLYVTCD